MFQCELCDHKPFPTERGRQTHMGMKHKGVSVHLQKRDEDLLNELVAINQEADDEEGGWVNFRRDRALRTVRDIRATLSQLYGIDDDSIQKATAVEYGFHMETIRATAETMANQQKVQWQRSVDSRILAAQRLAESSIEEGDVFAAVVAPIELGMDSQVWVSGGNTQELQEINDLLSASAWNVTETINAAWQDMETYSAFYILHEWRNGVPTPIHLSPKHVCVGPDTGFGPLDFRFLTPGGPASGDRLQTQIEFGESGDGGGWNEWMQSMGGKPLDKNKLTWVHFMKPKHKMYPYPWLAKAATPVYTRQIIEEMRLALVQGVINQLWVMTIENPLPGEVSKLRSLLSSNRAERVGFLLWRAGLAVQNYSPDAIEQLLLPEAWWSATLDIFRRMGRTIRIISGEPAQRAGQGSGDAEIDVRVAQNKAMAHRSLVANKVVFDLLRQWNDRDKSKSVRKLLDSGKLRVHMTPIQLFLGEDLEKIWGPMWDKGIASVRTIHAALGLDTDAETVALEAEEKAGFGEKYIARQQFAQRVATPQGPVTSSPEPGRPEGTTATAAIEDTQDALLNSFDTIDAEDDQDERRRRVQAFIILLTVMIRSSMRDAYRQGYDAAFGKRGVNSEGIGKGIDWEQQYIENFQGDLLAAVDMDRPVGQTYRYRVPQHVQASWRRAYMDGVFQAKGEDGWRFWQRVLRPNASKTRPCEICREDSKRWHPISEPFWDHPYGVCSAQVVRFMQTSTEGWEAFDRQQVAVPRMDWEE